MRTRNAVSAQEARHFDTAGLREAFLIQELFKAGELAMTYSHIDRIIVGSAVPEAKTLELGAVKETGADSFLERRELGVMNIGAAGTVSVAGQEFALDTRDGLYVGRGAKDIKLSSVDKRAPAKFYFLSAPAHCSYPTKKVCFDEATRVHLGERKDSNVRTIHQYIHPAVLQSCQLVMGMTILEPENVWNTMPTHTHERRTEVYLYFDLPQGAAVFHYMGQPGETRHLVVRNNQAVISPSWSIHAGVGTTSYSFIWGMAGENQTFTDMDHVPMNQLM